jgi:anti-sigma regulatory factor (Ser/Thr protein kinase)
MQAAVTQARRERKTMTNAAPPITSLIALTLPSTPDSVQKARFHTRTALDSRDLGDYAEDAETIASELVTNAITHAGAATFGLDVMHLERVFVAVIVSDSSLRPPVKRRSWRGMEHGHGLLIVDALSAAWGWQLQTPGKAVYAILTREV